MATLASSAGVVSGLSDFILCIDVVSLASMTVHLADITEQRRRKRRISLSYAAMYRSVGTLPCMRLLERVRCQTSTYACMPSCPGTVDRIITADRAQGSCIVAEATSACTSTIKETCGHVSSCRYDSSQEADAGAHSLCKSGAADLFCEWSIPAE